MGEDFDKKYRAAEQKAYEDEKLRLAEEVGKARALQSMEAKPEGEGLFSKFKNALAKARASGIGDKIRNAPGIQLGVRREQT